MGGYRYRDLLALLARGSDVGMGMPEDHGVRTAVAAHRIATLAGASPRDTRDAVFVALLRFCGCTADSHVAAHVMGDEVTTRGAMYGRAHFAEPREMLSFIWERSGEGGAGLAAQLQSFARTLARIPSLMQTSLSHCEVNDIVAERLGLDAAFRQALGQSFEVWNGGGTPKKLKGEAIALATRIAIAADEVEAAHRLDGANGIRAIAARRAGRALDPKLCEVIVAGADAIAEALAGRAIATLGELDIADEPTVDATSLESACEALADFADLKCDYTRGHSSAVASLAAAAAALLRVPQEERACLRRAALVHDVGRVGVGYEVWHKAGPLDDAEWSRVRMHTMFTESILGGGATEDAPLAKEAELAALAHERLDGSGYHRRLPPVALTNAARVLAAADVFQALTSARPHRAALTPSRAADVLREEVHGGRLAGDAVEAVIAAAGERPKATNAAPRGLTEREVEVLGLIARGLSNKQIAEALGIAPKTAGNHVQNVLGKIGVSTRAAAAMFAMRAGLVS